MAAGANVGMVLVAVLSIVGTTIAIFAVYAARYNKVPLNAALIVYGRRHVNGKGYKIVTGGGTFVVPIIEEYTTLPLHI